MGGENNFSSFLVTLFKGLLCYQISHIPLNSHYVLLVDI